MLQIENFFFPRYCIHCESKSSLFPLCKECVSKLSLLNPKERCGHCFEERSDESPCCCTCAEKIFLGEYPLCRILSAFAYEGVAKALLHFFKYAPRPFLAPSLASFMVMQWLKADFAKPDALVAVPPHWTKRLFRLAHPSILLAEEISSMLQIPLTPILKATNSGFSQSRLNQEERRTSSKEQRFFCTKPILGATILLIDDVATTGETLTSCARELYKAGAWNVQALTLCR